VHFLRPSRLVALFLILAALSIIAAPAAIASGVPKGDDQNAPVLIALNTAKTVKHIENATLQAPSIEEASCDPNDLSDHSIWFRFTVPISMLLDIDASGAIITGAQGSHNLVVLSYYEDEGTLTQRGCTTGTNARLTNQLVSAGDVFYVRVANIG
jgi:hypothetical protein